MNALDVILWAVAAILVTLALAGVGKFLLFVEAEIRALVLYYGRYR